MSEENAISPALAVGVRRENFSTLHTTFWGGPGRVVCGHYTEADQPRGIMDDTPTANGESNGQKTGTSNGNWAYMWGLWAQLR